MIDSIKRLGWLATVACSSCIMSGCRDNGVKGTESGGVRVAFARSSGRSDNSPIKIIVSNLTNDTICFLPRDFDVNSGSVKIFKNDKIVEPSRQTEYKDTLEGFGPYYLVSPGSKAIIPVNDTGIKAPPGIYNVTADVRWEKCDAILSSKNYKNDFMKKQKARASIRYEGIFY